MNEFKINKISKSNFLKINEDNVMFITNPGRMGDEDGSTFIVKDNDYLIIYRVDGWIYPTRNDKNENIITLSEFANQFPKWYDAWKNSKDKNYSDKYQYLYMGFGNGLCVDKTIYNEFEPYLNDLVTECLNNENDGVISFAIYKVWKNAFINMVNSKKYILK